MIFKELMAANVGNIVRTTAGSEHVVGKLLDVCEDYFTLCVLCDDVDERGDFREAFLTTISARIESCRVLAEATEEEKFEYNRLSNAGKKFPVARLGLIWRKKMTNQQAYDKPRGVEIGLVLEW